MPATRPEPFYNAGLFMGTRVRSACATLRMALLALRVELSARPHIQHIAVLCAHVLDPAYPGVRIGGGVLAIDRYQRGLDVGLHPAAVAADIDDRALLDQPPDLLLLGGD